MTQDSLVDVPATVRLTDRQQHVYDALQAQQLLEPGDAGRLLHAAKGCTHCGTCEALGWHRRDGRSVLGALARKGLAVRRLPEIDGRRREVFALPGVNPQTVLRARESADEPNLQTGDIPW